MSFKEWLLLCVFIPLVKNPCVAWAQDSAWEKRFHQERRLAFGSVENHSSDEVKRFLLLDGKQNPPVRPALIPLMPVEIAPLPAKGEAIEIELVPQRPRRKKRSEPKQTIPIEALLKKSRRAYESGQLEDAKRFYTLVKKADPSSSEAMERLEQIEREMQ